VTLCYDVYGQGRTAPDHPRQWRQHRHHGRPDRVLPLALPRYRVIAMDSRDQGKSGDNPGKITHEKMTDDLAALLEHLKTGPVDVLGWSHGGIEALLLGIRHPTKVKKITPWRPT
jgi:pimeloyl-ACP methyl ester carboxylesterase